MDLVAPVDVSKSIQHARYPQPVRPEIRVMYSPGASANGQPPSPPAAPTRARPPPPASFATNESRSTCDPAMYCTSSRRAHEDRLPASGCAGGGGGAHAEHDSSTASAEAYPWQCTCQSALPSGTPPPPT